MNSWGIGKMTLAFCLIFWMGIFHPAFSQMSPKLKEFLQERDFLELIDKYGMNHIILRIEGRQETLARKSRQPMQRGYRCQVFAGSLRENAQRVALQLRALNLDSVYLLQSPEKIYKVQMGDYPDRHEAERMLSRLWKLGYRNAWLVETDIYPPFSTPLTNPTETTGDTIPPGEFYYAVQIFATIHPEKARQLQSSLRNRLKEPVQILHRNTFWKVVVGRFRSRSAAEAYRHSLKKQGFPDAWITQIDSH